MSPSRQLSILVVSFNTRELTLECLRSVAREAAEVDHELVLIDNASIDGSADAVAQAFPQVRLVRLERNIGFAAANNLAARQARGRWLLLLNPDTVVLDQAIQRVLDFGARHPGAIVGGRTLFPDGRLNPTSCHGWPTLWSVTCLGLGLASAFRRSRLFDPESLGGWQRDSVRAVPVVTGCFLLISRDTWDRLGGFDESFFMYGEETDLCMRAATLGIPRLICPEARNVHHGGASETARADKLVRVFAAKRRLFEKHWPAAAAAYGTLMLRAWALTRLAAHAVGLALGRDPGSYRAWRQIWRRRAEYSPARARAVVRSRPELMPSP